MSAARRLAAAALLAAAVAGPAAAQQPGSAIRPRTAYEDLQMFSQVLNQIRVNHPDSLDTHRLYMAAIEGMVRAADPHSYVIPATRLSPEKEQQLRERRFEYVPVDFAYYGGSPVVVSVTPGTAATRQDILPGDELVAVDGQPVLAESPFELAITLAGPRNSTVALTFERRRVDGSLARLERTVKRERAAEATAVPATFLMADGQTGYVRVTTFSHEKVAEDLHDALRRLEREGMRRLVLDLRDNGGGLVDEATRIAGEFLPTGAVVYSSRGRKAELNETVHVRRSFWRSERRYPIVLLQNEGSASASELVAGALQDHDRALVVGRPSFGKSLLMQTLPMSDGSVISLVVGHLQTPCGRVIQRQYRNIRQQDYYRMARAERDTVGRPWCTTAAGRRVFGGGGIYPDVLLPEAEPTPLWLARVSEEHLPEQWVGGWITANAAAFTTPEALAAAPTLPAAAIADFRRFAEGRGVAIPAGADADARLTDELVRGIAWAKWGEAGFYRVAAALDRDVAAAVREFARAEALVGPQG